jgi:carbonic anhydrase
MAIDKLLKGNKHFRKVTFSKYEEDFNTLVKNGQKPQILFIGCSDSRVVPDLIVDSNPGDMFILRNIGNFVPPYKADHDYHGSSAAIEYAVSVLKVKDIIVCGHSHCGACESLYDDSIQTNDELLHVSKWLELGKKAKDNALIQWNKSDKKVNLLRITEKVSIKYQLENLMSFPVVAKRVKSVNLTIHGWYYKIEDGTIEVYDSSNDRFDYPF